jgi:hypothetical protein
VPLGAASLSLAVLENDGRKREVAIESLAGWQCEGRRKKRNNVRCVPRQAMGHDAHYEPALVLRVEASML